MPTYEVRRKETMNGPRWEVIRSGAKRFAMSGFIKQSDAVEAGKGLAARHNGRLIVFGVDGTKKREYAPSI